jgi:hypothetical protein
VAFSVIFWFVWTFVMRPLSAVVASSGAAGQSQSQDTQQDALMKKYLDQAKAADDLQAHAVRQAEESDRLLVKQADLQKRFEAVIEGWERQSSSKR